MNTVKNVILLRYNNLKTQIKLVVDYRMSRLYSYIFILSEENFKYALFKWGVSSGIYQGDIP